jgi:ribosome maturation factor RimP
LFDTNQSSAVLRRVALTGRLFLFLDASEPQHASLESRLAAIVGPTLEGMGYELVRVVVLGRDRPTVQVMADRADGSQITVADCEAISHGLGAVLDVEDPIPGTWSLEISSAGIDRPLTRPKDWNRFAGHLARAETVAPVEGRRRFSGIALGADETGARLRLDDGNEIVLPLNAIRRAKLVLTDALIAATATPPRTN